MREVREDGLRTGDRRMKERTESKRKCTTIVRLPVCCVFFESKMGTYLNSDPGFWTYSPLLTAITNHTKIFGSFGHNYFTDLKTSVWELTETLPLCLKPSELATQCV